MCESSGEILTSAVPVRAHAARVDELLAVERRLRAALVALHDVQGGEPCLRLAGLRAVQRLCRSAELTIEQAMVHVEQDVSRGRADES